MPIPNELTIYATAGKGVATCPAGDFNTTVEIPNIHPRAVVNVVSRLNYGVESVEVTSGEGFNVVFTENGNDPNVFDFDFDTPDQ